MKIAGFQKTTLIDYPGKIACTIFLYGCNFRCGYCYNPTLVTKKPEKVFSEEEIFSFLEKRRGVLEAVCITGGEALMSLEISFLKKIKSLGYLIKIDTNGSYPEKLKEIIREGLVDYIAMDLKASPENYSKITNRPIDITKLEETIGIIHSFGNYEFRTTIIMRYHSVFEISSLGKWINSLIGKPKRYYLQGFRAVREMVDSNFKDEVSTTEKYLKDIKECSKEYFSEVGIRF